MAKSHPAQLDEQAAPQLPDWARNTMASFTLLTCLVSLNVILHNQHGVRVVGAVANGVAALDLAQLLADAPPKPVVAEEPHAGKYRAVGDYLARRYRVSSEMTANVVAKAHVIGAEVKLDPLLILAVIAVESITATSLTRSAA